MVRIPYSNLIRKRPRRFHRFRPLLSMQNAIEGFAEYCNECMEKFQAIVDNERPGHAWRVEKGTVVYMEDEIMEDHLGRKLKTTESIIHRNGKPLDNRIENLELVNIESLES